MNKTHDGNFSFPLPFILIFVAITGILIECGESYRNVTDTSIEPNADIKIGNFYRLSIDSNGTRKWEIKARESYIFQKKGHQEKIIAYRFFFRQFNEYNRPIVEINAVRGEINYKKNRLFLTGKVRFKSSRRIITAEKMEYDVEEKILNSNVPVKIRERGLFTLCRKGVRVEKNRDRQVCKSPAGVHTRIPGANSKTSDSIFQ